MKVNKKELGRKEEKALLTFLKKTKKGKYAKIEESSLLNSRINEQREGYCEDVYYYSIR
jgi:hypothetical protein